MPVDKWGIPFFYPTKDTAGLTGTGSGFYWTQSNNVHDDDDFEGDAMLRIGKEHDLSTFKVLDESTGEWQFPFNFSGDDGLSLSGPTGHHTGGETHGCQGFTYMINVSLEDNPPKFRFRKETYHVQYDNHPDGLWTHPSANRKIVGGGWFGYGWVAYNRKDGRAPGKDSRICECWWNNDPVADITKWEMLRRVEDKGDGITNWGVAATCHGEAHQVGTWSNIQFRFKVDASDFSLHPLKPEPDDGPNINSIGGEDMSFADCESRGYGYRKDMPRDIEMKCLFRFDDTSGKCRLKNVSIREIDPTKSFDDNPNTPPPTEGPPESTTTLQGFFKFQQDINTYRTSACAGTGTGGGSGSGNTIFYEYSDSGEQEKELSNASTFQKRTRVVMQAANNSSILKGKLPIQVDIPLRKQGSPPSSPVVNMKIWSNSGSVIYTSPTNLDPSTLTTSFVKKTFDFSTNTHVLVTGDRIGVEYTYAGGTNYILFQYNEKEFENTNYYHYEDGVWEFKSRKLSMDIWE